MKIYYLASPFSHPDHQVVKRRILDVEEVYFNLLKQKIYSYSPIIHNAQIAVRFGLPGNYGFWKVNDTAFINKLDGVIVAQLDGWRESLGVTDEIRIARELEKPVLYYSKEQGLKKDHI